MVMEDRLSELPDELLIPILSLLPTKDAAATCVLSRKLRHIFPLITSLDFYSLAISHRLKNSCADERFSTFVTFVNTVLQKYQSHYLTRFRLRICNGNTFVNFIRKPRYGNCCDYNCSFRLVLDLNLTAWISFPLNLCGLKELDLCIEVGIPACFRLPPEVFSCDTLQVLKLEFDISLHQVSNMPSIIRLPNLKLLHLSTSCISQDGGTSFIFRNGLLPRLVSSCPLLEDLKVVALTNHAHHLTIVSPSLRRLCLGMRTTSGFKRDNHDLVQIDTPNLEYLEYFHDLRLKYSIPMLDRLVEAKVDLDSEFDYDMGFDFFLHQFLCFIRSLSNVQHLHMDNTCLKHLAYTRVRKQLPVFPNLKHLKLGCVDYRDTVLWEFLNCSPVLETLVIGFITRPGLFEEKALIEFQREFFRTVQETPLCCRSHLKRLVINIYIGYEPELELIQLLLRHAKVLRELVIYRWRNQIPLPDQTLIQNTLKNLPRASVSCTIQVF